MRVLRLTPFFHHEGVQSWPSKFDPVGGMQIQILTLSRSLARAGVEQLVLTLGFPGLPPTRRLADNLTVRIARAPLPQVRSEITGLVGLGQAWLVGTVAECVRLRRAGWRPDVIHVHADGQVWPLLAARVAARLLDAPYVLTLHCSRLAVYQPMSAVDRALDRFVTATERSTLRAASAVTTLTAHTADVVSAETGLARESVVVATDGVAIAPAEPGAAQAFAAEYGLDAGRPLIGYVGRVAHEKGWQDLLPLANELADLDPQFLVVGDGPQRERMERELAAAGLRDRFTITGFLPHHRVPAALELIDVLVMPSRHEELGGSAVEALLLGTPVAAYAVGGLRSTVGSVMPELLADPLDVSGLANVVRVVLGDRPKIVERLIAARADIAHAFHPDRARDLVLDCYRAVVVATTG